MNSQLSAKFTLWCSRGLFIIICLLTFAMPGLLRWYQTLRPLGRYGAAAIMVGFYCCVPAVLYALSCMERLVRNILKEDVFVTQNVRFLRRIRWCCAAVSGICLPAAFFYPPLIFMTMIMAFLALAAKRKMTSLELANRVGMTPANLSILKTGKAKAVRMSTMDAICRELQCQPGDLFEFVQDDDPWKR